MKLCLASISLFLVAAAVMPTAVSAGCGFGDINATNANVAIVEPAKLHFVEDDALVKGCPNESAGCQSKSYLVKGDVVLTGDAQGAYVCTGYVTANGKALNEWLPMAALETAPADVQRPRDWVGTWTMYDNDIVIQSKGNGFAIHGDAVWRGGSVHTGNLDGVASPVNGAIAFTVGDGETLPFEAGDELDCRVNMVRRGPYLLVRDNDQCGGANVTFTGFYRRSLLAKH
ncbi:hypothetical protein SAMN07250955_101103 [Arboricoccus pini]|uniref:Lipoprotein n=1 Tax=Arboricoccus pini TaxID=1963835 RepID=A0A212PX63_9PROT|nr:hypothetical protein [Arboricoccus pini]SNB51578.1 hypothetical protein SAMN07250955_101103 [Arboricoccus pini]